MTVLQQRWLIRYIKALKSLSWRIFMIYKNNDNYYSCYSPKLHDFLGDFDIEPIDEFTNIKTQKKCWVYQKDERLSIFLTQWTNNKKQGGE